MARLTILAAIFAVLLAITEASIYRTTITITEIEDNPGQSERCREEIQSQQLSHCEKYLMQESQRELMLRSVRNRSEQHLDECCRQLEQMKEQCRCEGLSRIVQQKKGQLQSEEMQEMVQCARNLPAKCRMEPQRCEIQTVRF